MLASQRFAGTPRMSTLICVNVAGVPQRRLIPLFLPPSWADMH